MRRALSTLLLTAFLLPSGAWAFSDIDASPYRSDILALKDAKLLTGYADGTFRPKAKVNRAELVKVAMGEQRGITVPKRRCFPDVAVDAWYAPSVCEAKQRRVVKGYDGGTFQPEATVNVAEALSVILRANHIPVPAGADPWYEPYVAYAHEHGIISRNSYRPWDPLTRERMAQILNGLRRHEAGETPSLPDKFLSAGCGKTQPARAPSSVDVNGTLRSFLLDLPAKASAHQPAGIIFAFHGRTNSNSQVRDYFELKKYATDFMVVYPAALKNGSSFNWNATDGGDYAFFDRMLASLGEEYCLDMDRVFVVGHSLGAWFGNSLACARGDVIRGSATLGGDAVISECTGPVAAMVMHNPHDNLAPFEGGIKARDQHLSQNSCDPGQTKPVEPASLKCVEYTSCAPGHPVLWCPHEIDISYWDNKYYPHVWPKTTGKYIAEFFRSL